MTIDISANYLGLRLSSPVIVGSCSLTKNAEFARTASIAGAGALVLPSLFQEQVVHQMIADGKSPTPKEQAIEAACFQSSESLYNGGPEGYISTIENLKNCTGIPIIASLNGYSDGHWLRFAEQLEQAGANALEVTLEPELTDPGLSGDEIESQMLKSISALSDLVSIPVSVKLSPYHTNLCNTAWRIVESGGQGLVCFAHEPSWKLELDRISAAPVWGLTQAGNINPTVSGLLRIRSQGPDISLAASGGVSSVSDLINVVVAGASVVMITSELYRSGADVISHLNDGLVRYLDRHGFNAFSDLVAARPKVKPFLRSMHADCLTNSHPFVHRIPVLSKQMGDRWGHTQLD